MIETIYDESVKQVADAAGCSLEQAAKYLAEGAAAEHAAELALFMQGLL